uniref:DH4 n=1 Tax=Locusta migratoria TaxID=7004 RepID=A0A385XQ75_LOCMI|nr:DH4 [Locusta migratoria]
MESSMDVLPVALLTLAALLFSVETSEFLHEVNDLNGSNRDSGEQTPSAVLSRSKRNNSGAHVDKWFRPDTGAGEDYWNALFREDAEDHLSKPDASTVDRLENVVPTAETPRLSVAQHESRHSEGSHDDHSDSEPEVWIGQHSGRSIPEPGTWFGPRIGRSHTEPGLWFGPRYGRSYPEPGMWFGPRVGRGHPEPEMWFGPRVGRNQAEPGVWFGARIGRNQPEPGTWFGARIGRSHPEPGMWF